MICPNQRHDMSGDGKLLLQIISTNSPVLESILVKFPPGLSLSESQEVGKPVVQRVDPIYSCLRFWRARLSVGWNIILRPYAEVTVDGRSTHRATV